MTCTLRTLVCLASCVFAGVCWADTRVRSGEHSTFTRLVLYLPGPVDSWAAIGTEDGFDVAIAPMPRALDTSDVFAFIPRTRISDLALQGGKVRIASTCDCHISIFRVRADVIAIDVRDGPDPSGRGRQARALPPKGWTAFPVLFTSPEGSSSVDWRVEPLVALVLPEMQDRRTPSSADLATAVARAATGGVLRANTDELGLDGPGIETRSALDSARSDRTARLQTELCSHISQLDALDGMSEAKAWQVIDHAPTGASAVQRAMAYLSLGFGAEAAVDFGVSELPADEAILLTQIAHFIDAPDRPAPRSVRSASACGGVAGLLAVVGAPPSESIVEPLGLEAVNTLSRLPFPLRAHLAGYLEVRLQSAGLPDLAQSARFARLRATDAPLSIEVPETHGVSGRPVPGQGNVPSTAFFNSSTSAPIYDAIAAARFAPEDRILIEAWIKEAPSASEADAASALYVAALNTAERPLEAIAHLDSRFGWRGLVPPGLEPAITDTIETATRVLGPAELLVLGARLSQRPWFDRLPQDARNRFHDSVDTIRFELTGGQALSRDAPPQPQSITVTTFDPDASLESRLSNVAAERATASPRRVAADAAIAYATDSLSRSARLRAEAAERSAEWGQIAQP